MRYKRVIIIFSYILSGLLFSELLHDGGRRSFVAGGSYFAVASLLNLLAMTASVWKKRFTGYTAKEGLVAEFASLHRGSDLLLISGYLVFFLSWLNVVSLRPDLPYQLSMSVVILCVCAFLYYLLAKIPGSSFERDEGAIAFFKDRPKSPGFVYSTLVILFGVPVMTVLILAVARHNRLGGFDLPPILHPAGVALLSISFCSLLFAALLFRTGKLHILPIKLRTGVWSTVGFVAASVTLQVIAKQNLCLYGLSLLSFLGLMAGFLRIWAAVRAQQMQEAPCPSP